MITLNGPEMRRVAAIQVLPALLLQMLHPLVAHAVYGKGSLVRNPAERLTRTGSITAAILEGNQAAAAQLRDLHGRIQGTLEQRAGKWHVGTSYSASDPELLLWVFATLVETRLDAYEELFGRLPEGSRPRLYLEARPFAFDLGIPERVLPPDYEGFRFYYEGMIDSLTTPNGSLAMTPAATEIKAALFSMRTLWGINLGASADLLAAALMPAPAREAYELRWTSAQQASWPAVKAVLRSRSS